MTEARAAIGIIGCGNMGAALVENLNKFFSAKDIFVFDKDVERQNSLVNRFGVCRITSIDELCVKSEAIIIAVKPQDIDGVLNALKGRRGKLFISIAAGITISYMRSILGKDAAIVRAMPNLNALIAKSVTALSLDPSVSEGQKAIADKIFRSVGEVVFVKEEQMNAVTAVSGSGPAFVAYLIDKLGEETLERVFFKEAIKFKIGPDVAKVLASKTIEGTKAILAVNFDAPTLIKRVCSKGGTTEAGMKVLEEIGKTEEALALAIQAAQKRAGELAREG